MGGYFLMLSINSNDRYFLKLLLEQKMMTVTQGYGLAWEGFTKKHVYLRINRLVEEGLAYEERLRTDRQKVFFLSQEGLKLLKELGLSGGLRLPEINPKEIHHDLLVNDVRIKFKDMGFPDWTSERKLAQEDNKKGIPDGAFHVETKGLIAVEVELTQKKTSSYYHHFRMLFEKDRFDLCFYFTQEGSIKRLVEKEAKEFGGIYVGYLNEFLDQGYAVTLRRGEFTFPLEKLRRYAKR